MRSWLFLVLLTLIWPLTTVLEKHGDQPVLVGLDAISAVLGGALWRLPEAVQSLPPAVRAVETSLNSQENTSN